MLLLHACLARLTAATSRPLRWLWWLLALLVQGSLLVLFQRHRSWLLSLYRHHSADRARRWQQLLDARLTFETSHTLDARARAWDMTDRIGLEYARLDALVRQFRIELEQTEHKIEAARDFRPLAALRDAARSSVGQ